MQLSAATANLYLQPFEKVLEIIAAAGFQNIDLNVTFDTTHYAQIGTDIVAAARILGKSIRTIHLSDFSAGRTHLFPGEGELDFSGFFGALDKDDLKAVTLESSLSIVDNPGHEMSYNELVSRLAEARTRLERFLAA
jgi:sugar phosphate isomerase/epimerase